MLKYGVVATATLLDDLHSWRHLYLAGRLHKPVQWLSDHNKRMPHSLSDALGANERAACAASLILAQRVDLKTLLATLVGLSYRGDVRVGIAEDAAKVQRIVQGSYDGLVLKYRPALGLMCCPQVCCNHHVMARRTAQLEAKGAVQLDNDGMWQVQDIRTLEQWLPPSLRGLGPQGLSAALTARVARSSRRQALLGLLSAGLSRSLRYAGAKVAKAWRA